MTHIKDALLRKKRVNLKQREVGKVGESTWLSVIRYDDSSG